MITEQQKKIDKDAVQHDAQRRMTSKDYNCCASKALHHNPDDEALPLAPGLEVGIQVSQARG